MGFIKKQLAQLNDRLGGSIQNLNGDRIVQFSNKKGEGKILGSDLGAEISYMEFDLNTSEQIVFKFDSLGSSELYFIYCSKGKLRFNLNDKSSGKITSLQTAILGGANAELRLRITENEDTKFAVIRVARVTDATLPLKDLELNEQVFERFLKDEPTIDYLGTFNLKIREQLEQIHAIKQRGVVRTLLIKGIIHFTLALEILHYDNDKKMRERGISKLTQDELLRVAQASKEIETAPEYPFSVDYLSRKYALSPAKLQEGFKFVNGTTVSNFVKDKRVETAERLIKTTDMNISEVVYSVGFTSRSYFSKIFKKRYDCSPKYYRQHANVPVSVA